MEKDKNRLETSFVSSPFHRKSSLNFCQKKVVIRLIAITNTTKKMIIFKRNNYLNC